MVTGIVACGIYLSLEKTYGFSLVFTDWYYQQNTFMRMLVMQVGGYLISVSPTVSRQQVCDYGSHKQRQKEGCLGAQRKEASSAAYSSWMCFAMRGLACSARPEMIAGRCPPFPAHLSPSTSASVQLPCCAMWQDACDAAPQGLPSRLVAANRLFALLAAGHRHCIPQQVLLCVVIRGGEPGLCRHGLQGLGGPTAAAAQAAAEAAAEAAAGRSHRRLWYGGVGDGRRHL
jgi:hypothetical protein